MNKNHLSDLHFFTESFPTGMGETFIENELPILASHFNRIKIYPLTPKTERNRFTDLPVNVEVILTDISNIKLTLYDQIIIIKCLLIELIGIKKKWQFIKKLRTRRSELKQAVLRSNYISCSNHDFYYSYWMNNWCLTLSILKMKKRISSYVFRCGGFDIWDERWPNHYMPFKYLNYKFSKGIYPNSRVAEKYLKSQGNFSEKIKCLYWGTKDMGISPFSKLNDSFVIISCANLIPLKRIKMIPCVLSELKFKFLWIHFGDGAEMGELNKLCKSMLSEGTYDLRGRVSNSEILNFYAENQVDLFLSLSSSEGLPVSMQEAISFGIPVMGTNVGGVSEIVNERTGLLIPPDFDNFNVAETIAEFKSSIRNDNQFRIGVRDYWKSNFQSDSVYQEFVKILFDRN